MLQETLTGIALALTSVAPIVPLDSAIARHEHTLATGGSDTYSVRLQKGGWLGTTVDQRGIDVAVHLVDPAGKEVALIDSPNGTSGPERVEFEAQTSGTYRITVVALDPKAASGRYAVTDVQVLSPAAEIKRLADLAARRAAVRAWLALRAVPLAGDEAGFASGLAPALRGVTVLGLGEGSHGSHELFDLRARIVRSLVRTQGFRTLAMELDRVMSQRLDDYVHSRTDQIAELKPWDTEEVVALLNWLRDWNRSASPVDQVTIIGIDGQDRISGTDQLVAYLRRAAPDQADAVATLVANKKPPIKLDAATAAPLQQGYVDLLAYFDLHATALIARSSRADYDDMRGLVQVLSQTGSLDAKDNAKDQPGRRDEYMADNLRRYIDAAASGTKLILWAHDGHVQTTPGNNPPMGYYLRKLYGQGYYALGSTFAEGEYQSWTHGLPTFALGVYRAADLPDDAIERDFATIGDGPFTIDFRAAPRSPPVSEWLSTPKSARLIGAMYDPAWLPHTLYKVTLADSYDGYLFVRRSTRARPTARMIAKFGEVGGPPAAQAPSQP